MQTFLVSYNLSENFKYLDKKRLFKQLLEGYQILNSLVGDKKGWQNHPAVKQFSGYEYQLYDYLYHCRLECDKRKIALDSQIFNKASQLIAYLVANDKLDKSKVPNWWGRKDIINSHKSRLLCKGEIDVVCAAIKKSLKLKNIDIWLKEKYKKTKNQLKWADCIELKNFCKLNHIDITEKNWYSQFGWDNDPGKEYVWPI